MGAHEQWEEQAAAYALDALDPDERTAFLAHLAGCAQCREQVDQHALVAAQLGSLAGDETVEPPPWSAIRAGVVGTGSPEPAGVVPLRRRHRAAAFLAAAAAAVAVAVGVVVWQVGGGTSSPAGPLASVSACRQVADCHVIALRSSGAAFASVLEYHRSVAVVADGMSAPPRGSEWALWQVPRQGTPRLMKVFAGGRNVPADLVLPYADTAGFAISREPSGTTPAQPTVVVASGGVA